MSKPKPIPPCPNDKKAQDLNAKIDKFIENPAAYKNVVRENYEAFMTSKSVSKELKDELRIAKCTCKCVLDSDNKEQMLVLILTLYVGPQHLDDKYNPCIIDGVSKILNDEDVLKQITCDFLEERPFFETPLGIAVIVGGSVLLLAIIIFIVMHTSGGKRRRRRK